MSSEPSSSSTFYVVGVGASAGGLEALSAFLREDAPGGTRYVTTRVFPIRDEVDRARRVAAMSRDITRLKRAEEALREEKHRAEGANRAKSDFLAAMSHELRTPLNVIAGMTQLLARDTLPAAPARYVQSIDRASKVLLTLVEGVLDLSRIEAGKVTFDTIPFGLSDLECDLRGTFEIPMREISFSFGVEFPSTIGTQAHTQVCMGDTPEVNAP